MEKIINDLKIQIRCHSDDYTIDALNTAIDIVESNLKDCVITHKDQIDALPNNDKLGEYVRSLRNKI